MQQSDLDLMMLFNLIKERRSSRGAQLSRYAGRNTLERILALVLRPRRPDTAPARSSLRPGSAVGP